MKRNNIKKWICLGLLSLASTLAVTATTGCGSKNNDSSSSESSEIQEATLDKQQVSLEVGQTVQLTVKNATAVSWESSNSAIASVENGLVTALSAGQSVVSCTLEDSTQLSCLVTVTDSGYVALLNVSDETVSVGVNGEYTIQAEVTYAGAVVSNAVITFESLNPDVCTIDETGKIQGVKAGQATIVVSSSYDSKLLQKEIVVNICNNFGLFLEDSEFSLKTTDSAAKGWHSSMELQYKVMINGEERTDIPVVVTQLSGQDSVSLNGTTFSALNLGEATFTIEYSYEGETVKSEPFKVVVSDVVFTTEGLVAIDITTGDAVIPADTLGAMIQQVVVDNELQDLIASQDIAKIVYLGQAYTYDEFVALSFNEGVYLICVYLQGSNIGFEIALKFEKDHTLLYLLEENAYAKEEALKYWDVAHGGSILTYIEAATDANGESKEAISFENNYWLDDIKRSVLFDMNTINLALSKGYETLEFYVFSAGSTGGEIFQYNTETNFNPNPVVSWYNCGATWTKVSLPLKKLAANDYDYIAMRAAIYTTVYFADVHFAKAAPLDFATANFATESNAIYWGVANGSSTITYTAEVADANGAKKDAIAYYNNNYQDNIERAGLFDMSLLVAAQAAGYKYLTFDVYSSVAQWSDVFQYNTNSSFNGTPLVGFSIGTEWASVTLDLSQLASADYTYLAMRTTNYTTVYFANVKFTA